MNELTKGQNPRKALRRHKERGQIRWFTYDNIAQAMGLGLGTVRGTADIRKAVATGNLLILAREIVRRRGMNDAEDAVIRAAVRRVKVDDRSSTV